MALVKITEESEKLSLQKVLGKIMNSKLSVSDNVMVGYPGGSQ